MPDERAYNLTAYDADTRKQVFCWFQVAPNHQFVASDVIDHDGLSAALSSINKRESECLTTLERAFRNRMAIALPGMCSK